MANEENSNGNNEADKHAFEGTFQGMQTVITIALQAAG